MKFLLSILIGFVLILSTNTAHAYTSENGNDPNLGTYDVEMKSVIKSQVAGYSDALAQGQAVFYDIDNDTTTTPTGMSVVTLSQVNNDGTGGSAKTSKFIAGVVERKSTLGVATGDTSAFPLAVRGYVNNASCDSAAGSGIHVGDYLCVGTLGSVKGKFINCNSGVTSSFIAVSQDSTGTACKNLHVMLLNQ